MRVVATQYVVTSQNPIKTLEDKNRRTLARLGLMKVFVSNVLYRYCLGTVVSACTTVEGTPKPATSLVKFVEKRP